MEDAAISRYEHTPLPGSNYIRLLQLDVRPDGKAALTGSLITRNLDSNEPQYTSVSYSWGRNSDGDAALSRGILVDGRIWPLRRTSTTA